MGSETTPQSEYAPNSTEIRFIDRVESPEEVKLIREYTNLLFEPGSLPHFGWPLFGRSELIGVSASDLYYQGKPKSEYVDVVAEEVAGILNSSGDFLTVVFDTQGTEKKLVGAGMVGSPSISENEVWFYKDVVATNSQEGGYGTKLAIARAREVFRRHQDLKNVYVGVTYDRYYSDEEKVALQHTFEQMDVLHAIRNGAVIDVENLKKRVGIIQEMREVHMHNNQLEGMNDLVDLFADRLPLEGLTPDVMRVRRDILVDVAKRMGHNPAPSEYVYLKLGAYHTQLLTEQSHEIHGRDFPTGRMVLKRSVWERLDSQFESDL